ncbi:MAG: aminomethyltransferase family protein [Phycisphaerales bacterium]
MASESPLHNLQEQAEAEFLYYGDDESGVEIVATYGELEAEYAAIRKSAGLMDLPQRAVLRITGADRLAFLNNMVTNAVAEMTSGSAVSSFWLNQRGRIVADLSFLELGDEMLADTEGAVADGAMSTLTDFVFTEDVTIESAHESWHRLALHGPRGIELVRKVASFASDEAADDWSSRGCRRVRIADEPVIVERRDTTGEIGLELFVPTTAALEVYETLLEAGLDSGARSIGWLAYNIARIESGVPLFLVDFGTDSLPHETGLLRERVSFTKGCYLGQEVVARMENLGHPSKRLVGLRVEGNSMPVTGSQIFEPADRPSEVVGAVTSATPSPMLGDEVIALAMVKWSRSNAGQRLLVSAEGAIVPATVTELPFWKRR